MYKEIKIPDSASKAQRKGKKPFIFTLLILGFGGYAASGMFPVYRSQPAQPAPETSDNSDADRSAIKIKTPATQAGRSLASISGESASAQVQKRFLGESNESPSNASREATSPSESSNSGNRGVTSTSPRSNGSGMNGNRGNGSGNYGSNSVSELPQSKDTSPSIEPAANGSGGSSVPLVGNLPSGSPQPLNHSSDGGPSPGSSTTKTQGLLLNRSFFLTSSGGGFVKSSQAQIITEIGNVISPNVSKSSQLQIHSGITAFNE